MAISKFKVDFDPTAPAEHDRIGSFILGAGGDVASTTDLGGGVIALDVNVANVVLDSASGVFLEDAAFADGDKGQAVLMVRQDSLAASTSTDGDYASFKGTDKGELYVHDVDALAMLTTIEGDLDVVNTNLGTVITALGTIDGDLDAANITLSSIDTDTTAIAAFVAALDSVADDAVASGNALLVGAVAHTPAAALSAVSASLDKTHLATDLHRRLYVNDSMGVAWQCASVSVGTSAVRLDATPLATRRKVTIQNVSDKSIWVGSSNAVTSGSGLWIPKYSERDLPFTAALQVWAIGQAAALDVRFSEAG